MLGFAENDRDYSKSKFEFFKSGRREPIHQTIPNYGAISFKQIADRSKQNAQTLLGGDKCCKVFPMSTNGRLITGLGGASVYETNITLHHIYGFPYLPASSIKGIVRSWIIQAVFANEENIPSNEKECPLINAEYRAYQDKVFCIIFGCPSQIKRVSIDDKGNILKDEKGKNKTRQCDVALKNKNNKGQDTQGEILFFDAFPTTAPDIVPDVMNPHYGPYYNGDGNKPPADYHNPIPIFFLTVDKKTQFQFILGSRNDDWLSNAWKIGGKDIVEWLKDALQNYGIGAKTAVGYGYFS